MVLYARHERISGDLIKELFSVESFYTLGWGALFGVVFWSFVGGQVALAALTRFEFRKLQSKQFPVFFGFNTVLSTVLLGVWVWTHPDSLAYFVTKPLAPDALQAWLLTFVVGSSAANWFYVGPEVTRVMNERSALEKKEGKAYHDEGASEELKGITELFQKLHGASLGLNFLTAIALGLHGLWLGTFGAAGY